MEKSSIACVVGEICKERAMFKRLFKIVGGLAGMALGLVTASCGDSEKMATIYGPPSSFDGNYSLEEIECCGKKGTPESVEFQACIPSQRKSNRFSTVISQAMNVPRLWV